MVRNEQQCSYCGGIIFPNEEAVLIVFKKPGIKYVKVGHVECYRQFQDADFIRRWNNWRLDKLIKPDKKRRTKAKMKLGRPQEYVNPIKAARLRGLIYYYTQKGNTEKVLLLSIELDGLKSVKIKEVHPSGQDKKCNETQS
jgi:hypothetical protein